MEFALRPDFSIKTGQQLFPELYNFNPPPFNGGTWQHNPTVISALELPDDNNVPQKYYFQYNDYGEIARVILPTGGGFDYDYEKNGDIIPGTSEIGNVVGNMVYRRVIRRVTYNALATNTIPSQAPAATIEKIDEYNESYSGGTIVDNLHRNANGDLLAAERHYFYGTPIDEAYSSTLPTIYSSWKTSREYKTESLNISGGSPGAALRRAEMVWYPSSPPNQTVPPPNPKLT